MQAHDKPLTSRWQSRVSGLYCAGILAKPPSPPTSHQPSTFQNGDDAACAGRIEATFEPSEVGHRDGDGDGEQQRQLWHK